MATTAFLDTEELSEALKYARVEAVRISRGAFQAELGRNFVQDWGLQYIAFQQGSSSCVGDGPTDRYAILIPETLSGNCRLLGTDVDQSTIAVYAPGSEHADVTHAGSRLTVLTLPPTGSGLDANESGLWPKTSKSQLVSIAPPAIDSLRTLIWRIRQAAAETDGVLEKTQTVRCLADSLTRAVLDLSDHVPSREAILGRPRIPRPAIVRRTWELMSERMDEPIYATELAQDVGISQPTLQRLFIEWFGMPPARYLQIKRLYLARKRLRQEPTSSVTEVATSLGFWDLSRFAKGYKEAFGELPSETQRRARSVWRSG
jgi:AraC-like DNA-binding protein